MREIINVLSKCIIVVATVVNCLAGDDMTERASRLTTALNIPTNTESKATSRPVFSGSTTVIAGDFRMKQKEVTTNEFGSVVEVDILCKEGQVTIMGSIIECESTSAARKALVAKLVQNSMPLDLLIRIYELRRDGAGEFCIVKKIVDRNTGEYVVGSSVIHFVRDGKAISLYARKKGGDVRPAAKAVDAMICEGSGTDKPASRK